MVSIKVRRCNHTVPPSFHPQKIDSSIILQEPSPSALAKHDLNLPEKNKRPFI